MKKYRVWVRLNAYQTAEVFVHATHDWNAKLIAEAQYGKGNVLNYTLVDE